MYAMEYTKDVACQKSKSFLTLKSLFFFSMFHVKFYNRSFLKKGRSRETQGALGRKAVGVPGSVGSYQFRILEIHWRWDDFQAHTRILGLMTGGTSLGLMYGMENHQRFRAYHHCPKQGCNSSILLDHIGQ